MTAVTACFRWGEFHRLRQEPGKLRRITDRLSAEDARPDIGCEDQLTPESETLPGPVLRLNWAHGMAHETSGLYQPPK